MRIIAYILITTLLLLSVACADQTVKPTSELTLEEQKLRLKEKKDELSALQEEIDELQNKIVAQSPELQEKAKLVDTLLINKQDFKRYIDIQGRVVADDIVNVVSETAGRILNITAKEGDYVSKGQVIANIDLESLSKQKIELETALSLAVDMHDRQKRLWDQNIGSEVQYLQAKNSKERLEKSLETIDFQLTKSTVTAPISGSVDREILKAGEIASPGVPILTILNTRNLKVETDLPERFLTKLDRGDQVSINFPSIEQEMNGRVAMLGRTIDPANRTLKVDIKPAKYHKLLKPNLLAEIKVEELSIDDVVVIPSVYLLQQVDGQEYLYTVKEENNKFRAEKTYVTTSESSADGIIITEGLESGDIIVSKGARNISDGDLIIFE
jgi:RND family efflux transporter MFP subunit